MKYFIYIVYLVCSSMAYGQNSNLTHSKFDCVKRNYFSTTERLKYYPFNISKSIYLVSFKGDEVQKNFKAKRISDFTFQEVKSLDYYQIDSLTDILYNIGVKASVFKFTPSTCYIPRNAILFLDSENKVFEFIEICFECRRTRTSSNMINDGISCEQKFELLKLYFHMQGIKFGTEDL